MKKIITPPENHKKKSPGWITVALIGALQVPAMILILFLTSRMPIGIDVGFFNPLLRNLLVSILLTIATGFTLRKLMFQNPYRIATIGTLTFCVLSISTLSLIGQLMHFDKSSGNSIILMEIILYTASFLIAYSITRKIEI